MHLNAVGAAFLARGDHRLVGYQLGARRAPRHRSLTCSVLSVKVNAKPETAPKLRLTSSALVLPLVNLATLALILLAITSGGLTIYPAAVGVIVCDPGVRQPPAAGRADLSAARPSRRP